MRRVEGGQQRVSGTGKCPMTWLGFFKDYAKIDQGLNVSNPQLFKLQTSHFPLQTSHFKLQTSNFNPSNLASL